MYVLIVAEHDNKKLHPNTAKVVSAAIALTNTNENNEKLPITVLIAGHNCQPVAEQAAKIDGVEEVVVFDNPCFEHHTAENLAKLVHNIAQNTKYTHILTPASTFGKNFLPRVAALLNVAQVSDVVNIISPDTFVRPIYAGNALATVQVSDPIKVMTIRTTAFASAKETEQAASIETHSESFETNLSEYLGLEVSHSARPDLTSARVVISGGRGLQSGENFKLLESLADKLNAAIGASRAAVDAGYVPNDYQVGQTGKVVAPQLYIAVGISGAIQHLAGMKDSKVIVAINKDPDAPIFQVADYGLVGDLFQIIPEFNQELDRVLGK
ncbi:MAG: electron transfer flavoprotein subunit alpha/FixB family protein [Gammaproteobacteria bacterium]